MALTHCYSPSPLCSPARAGFLTGRTPFRTGIESWIPEDSGTYLTSEEVTLGTILKKRGYGTFLAGKWHLNGKFNHPEQTQPDDHGFDHWLATQNFTVPNHRNPDNFVRNREAIERLEGYSSTIIVDEAMQWLSGRDPGVPFFQFLSFHAPHSEIATPDRFNAIYADQTEGEVDLEQVTGRGPGEYYANITHLDHEIGRYMNKLDALGLKDDTLFVFTSDNGPVTDEWRYPWETNIYGSTAGLRRRKGDLYEGGIRVPGIIRYPGKVEAGTRSAAPVHGCDLLPTICHLLGIAPLDDRPIDGESIAPVLAGGSMTRRQPLYWQFAAAHGGHFAMRDGDWKIIADKEMNRFELFNLVSDPGETINLATRYLDRLKAMAGTLAAINANVASDPVGTGG